MNCKKTVIGESGWHPHQCSRKSVRDGYCKQHHPDAAKKRREDSDHRYKEQEEQSTWARLERCEKRLAKSCALLQRVTCVRRDDTIPLDLWDEIMKFLA